MGSTAEEVVELVAALDGHPQIAAFELNVSCPNVRTGLDLGSDPAELERLVERVRPRTARPLIVKLTPNTADVAAVAAAAERGGSDAVSLINTLRALALHPHRPGPWLGGGSGGLSGPAIRAVALEQVARVSARINIPVVGMGGVQSGRDAYDFMRAGATLVAVGTESFRDARAGARIARELHDTQSFAKSEFGSEPPTMSPHSTPGKRLQKDAMGSSTLNVA
jgi:dihydroorotate dehydrogenase (NAD+) catalytic subunit